MSKTKSSSSGLRIRPRVKLWIEAREESVLCTGMLEILTAVAETGSIKQAAEQVGRSYRFIWNRIKEAEDALGHQLVQTQVGGRDAHRSDLTPLALDLVSQFEEVRDEICQIVDEMYVKKLNQTLSRHGVHNENRVDD